MHASTPACMKEFPGKNSPACITGVPALKAQLNGVRMHKRWSDVPTLLAKLVGTALIVATGLPLDKDGPMMHLGAGMAMLITSVRVPFTEDLLELRMPNAQREWVGMGAAAGVAAAFRAPLSGTPHTIIDVSSILPRP